MVRHVKSSKPNFPAAAYCISSWYFNSASLLIINVLCYIFEELEQELTSL
jgi:hypothetical protein